MALPFHVAVIFLLIFIITFCCVHNASASRTWKFVNRCSETIWVGALNGLSSSTLPLNGGWEMLPYSQKTISTSSVWDGRFWPRTNCTFDANGKGICETGDCNGQLECQGLSGFPTASLAEFYVDSSSWWYDISLVDASNVAIGIRMSDASCEYTVSADFNLNCPPELVLSNSNGHTLACQSACEVFGDDKYCCTGAYDNASCPPSAYSLWFKKQSPTVYTYAYDTPGVYACNVNASPTIEFCPVDSVAMASSPPRINFNISSSLS